MSILDFTDGVSDSTRMVMNATRQPAYFSAQIATARRFYLDLQPTLKNELTVISGGWERCTPEYMTQRKGFPYLGIEYVAQGEGVLVLQDRTYKLMPGTVFSYGPGVAHDIRTDAKKCLLKYFVDFTGHKSERLLREAGLWPGAVTMVSTPTDIRETLDTLIEKGLQTTPHAPRLCAILLEYLIRSIEANTIQYGSNQSPAFSTYLRCRQLIEAQFMTLRTLEETATRCHVDAAYLCRLFRRYDHSSPYQFLLRLKMNRAADILRSRGGMVKQLADQLHYPDAYTFSRAFKAVHGFSPSRFLELSAR